MAAQKQEVEQSEKTLEQITREAIEYATEDGQVDLDRLEDYGGEEAVQEYIRQEDRRSAQAMAEGYAQEAARNARYWRDVAYEFEATEVEEIAEEEYEHEWDEETDGDDNGNE